MPKPLKKKRFLGRSAAALQYDEKKDPAPRITALGFGHVADRIVELAKTHGVPVHEDPHLASLLSQLDVGRFIPSELYHLVAEVLVFVYVLDKKHGEKTKPVSTTATRESVYEKDFTEVSNDS